MSPEQIHRILANAQTIASVGLSAEPGKVSHGVAHYLQAHGYRIIPVNPNTDSILGEKAFAALADIPEPIDVVQIFRPSNEVPAIVAQAIRKRAKVIWMQQGISSPEAARLAEDAGLEVIMDRCMRSEHRRLMGPRHAVTT